MPSHEPALPSQSALHLRIFRWVLIASLPSMAVGVYVFAQITGLTGEEVPRALGWLAVVFLVACAQQALTIGALVRAALAEVPGEPAGARLARLLVLPRKVELFSNLATWLVAGALFGGFVHLVLGHDEGAGLAVLLALLIAAFPGVLLVVVVEDEVLPLALAERARDPLAVPPGGGFLWSRQKASLPYAFAVSLVSLIGLIGLLLRARYLRAMDGLEARLAGDGLAAAVPGVHAFLQGEVESTSLGVALVAVVFLIAFCATGFLLARRQARAAAAVEEALATVVAGAPAPPRWVATDEIGDLTAAAARITVEMRSVFDQLRAMAAGDLGRELEGDSGLIQAFRVSREGMLELSRRMGALARGEAAAEASEVKGHLGAAFTGLQQALQAIAEQARTIAGGDLRRDMAVPGALGEAIQRMTANLRAMVGRTQEVSSAVGDLVVTLQASSAQLSTATTQQVAAVTETANTMTEMAQTSAVSADRAAELIRQGEAASAVSDEGAAAAESAVGAMVAIGSSLDRVAKASSALAQRVKKIDAIVDTVGFLADQSSTLAINAAIEAARAGDAGKGFSVVAREVRALAADSRKAAAEIRQTLGELREGTGQVDGAVTTGRRTVEEGEQLVQRLGEVVAQLGVTVHDAVGLMRQVEGSARQHQAGVGQVTQALTSMQSASESIRDGASVLNDLSTRAKELSASLETSAGAYALPGR